MSDSWNQDYSFESQDTVELSPFSPIVVSKTGTTKPKVDSELFQLRRVVR